jgi:hypothetical protein
MKKYVITEAQLDNLVNKLDEIWPFGNNKVEFSELPKQSGSDLGKQEPLSFKEFIAQSEKDSQADPNVGPPDIKTNVAANVSANSAQRNIDNAENSLLKIVGKYYKPIRSYSIEYENSVVGHAEDISLIILTIAYFVDKQKYQDIKINYDKNLIFLNAKNLSAILRSDSFKTTNVTTEVNPNDPNDVKLKTDNKTIVMHVTKQDPPVTKKVEFNNIKTKTIDEIIKYFNDIDNLNFVNRALSKKIKSIKKNGNQIVVTL